MVLSVHLTEPSPFGGEEWRVKFEDITSLRQARLHTIDLVLALVVLYHEEDEAIAAGQLDATKLTSLIFRMDQIVSHLHETQLMLPRFRPASGGTETNQPFWDTSSASTVASGMTAMTDASICIYDMLNRLSTMGAQGENSNEDATTAVTPGAAAKSAAPFVHSQGSSWREHLSQRVADAVEFLISEGALPGVGASLFPCRMMLNILPRDDPAYRRIARLHAQSLIRRNIRHAGDLSELVEGLSIGDENSQLSNEPDCGCGEDCGTVTMRKGRARWCGCPWAKRPSN
jgi:hypothetical protein